jgi:transketolase
MKTQANGKPKALIAHTKKGRGIPTLEDAPLCHIMNPKPELIDALLLEMSE